MLCAPDGGILDDLIVYRQAAERFLVVANAANATVVLAELTERCSGGAVVTDESAATGLISIQGPNGCGMLSSVTDIPLDGMPYYAGAYGTVAGRTAWIARTGYTGEDGFEIFCSTQTTARRSGPRLPRASATPSPRLDSRPAIRSG